MTRLCLVRHGQTDWNLEGRYQGQSDVGLNENGLEQARDLAKQLAKETFAAFYASDLSRARVTAEVIAAEHGMPVLVDERLREINQGEWEGLLVQVIRDRYDDLWQSRKIDPAGWRPPGGETVAEVAKRTWAALDDIAARYPDGRVLVASHGLTIATIICKSEGIPISLAYRHIPENAVPVWVDWPC